jgi:hypothetical protein
VRVDESLGYKANLCKFPAPYAGPRVPGRSIIPPFAYYLASLVHVDLATTLCVQQI